MTFLRKSWLKRRFFKDGSAMVYPDFHHWASSPASTKLDVGDRANFVFPFDEKSFLKEDFTQVGVADGFGRIHWSSRREFRKARERYLKDFS